MKNDYGCPVKAAANAISGKWKVMILWRLSFEPLRFSEIRKLLPGVSEKVLTAQLRELERDAILSRTITATVPPQVTYQLTDAGKELIPIMEDMCNWAETHLGVKPTMSPRPRPMSRKVS